MSASLPSRNARPDSPCGVFAGGLQLSMWVYDLQSLDILDVNDVAIRQFGYSRKDFLAMNIKDIVWADDVPQLLDHVSGLATAMDAHASLRYRMRDGALIEVECVSHALDLAGRRIGVMLACDPATLPGSEPATQERLLLHERMEKTAASVPGLTCSFRMHADGRVSMPYASAAIEDIYGLRAEDVAADASRLFALIHPDDVAHVNAGIAESARTMQPWHDTFRVRHPHKGERWIEGHSMPLREADGGILWHGYIQDVTERRRVEAALRESEQYCRSLLALAPDGIFIVDTDGRRLLDANEAACRMLAYRREALLALGTAELVVPEDIPRIAAEVERVNQGGVSYSTWRMRRQDGSEFDGEVTCRKLPDGRLHAFLRDITARRRVEEALRESEANLARAQAIAHVGSWRLDIQHDDLTWSAETYRIFGIAPGTPLDLARFVACVHPDDRARLLDAWNAAVAGAPYDIEHRILVGGEVKWVRERAEVRTDASGRPVVGFGAVQDVTEIKLAEEQLRIAAVAFDSREGMIVTDASGTILRVNRAFSEITGYGAEEAIGRSPGILNSGRQAPDFYRTMWEAISREGHWQGEIWNRRKDGSIYPEWLAISAIHDPDGRISHYLGVFSDISEPKEAQRKLVELAFYDSLTGLPNRRLLQDRLNQALAVCSRGGQFGALLLLDLDQFKTLNDTRGHDVGDQLLVEVARRLRDALREADTAARLGGDEFVVLLESLGADDMGAATNAEAAAEKIRAAIARAYDLSGVDGHITTSVGITLFRNHDENVDVLLKQADLALYQAKDAGRDTTRFYNPAMQSAMEVRADLEAGLRRALAEDELLLHYQPQMDDTGALVGVEALLRWQPQDRPMVSPATFIPVAEASGLILPIGRWVLANACRQLAAWAHLPSMRDVQLAVNISARQFRQPGFVAEVCEMIAHSGADPSRLKLELTESLVLEDVDHVIRTMTSLKAQGICFAIDDFGTGYSSLSYLKRLPLDQLKIDQSFVRGIPSDPDDCAIAQAIIALGRSLRLHVIAEGVETVAQRDFLASHGCAAYQGYLFGHPGPAEAIPGMARSQA